VRPLEEEETMNRIALDLGTTTGWATLLDGQIVSGVWRFQPKRHEGGGMRYVRFRNQLAELIEELSSAGPPCVYYEEVRRHKGTAAAHVYGGFEAHLTAYCDEHGIPYESVPVGTIKKHATAKGNANKAAMMIAARNKWPGEDFLDDNEADARWLLDYIISQEA
jgi:hypothetical protein